MVGRSYTDSFFSAFSIRMKEGVWSWGRRLGDLTAKGSERDVLKEKYQRTDWGPWKVNFK